MNFAWLKIHSMIVIMKQNHKNYNQVMHNIFKMTFHKCFCFSQARTHVFKDQSKSSRSVQLKNNKCKTAKE